jgi:hypothetical protein
MGSRDAVHRLRLLEGWLPLAQAINASEDWGYDGPTLEALILVALPVLRHACTVADAYAILRRAYHLYQRYGPTAP